MKREKLHKFKEIFFVSLLLMVLTFYQLIQSPTGLISRHLPGLTAWHLAVLGLVLGTSRLLERHLFRNWFHCSFLRIASVRAGIYLFFSVMLAMATNWYYNRLLPGSAGSGFFWTSFLFYTFVYFGATVIREVSKLAGRGFLDKLILGMYHRPKKEKRIFLFIDLRESTKLSKTLSLEKYSYFIKEFFRDIDTIMEKHEGEIYQYAGDEVIISWRASKFNYNRAVLSFLEFYKHMKEKHAHYVKQYNAVPRFKAAMHSGTVVGTWVGRIKRELVFQGEVLNIAARITNLAKNLSYPILLTRPIVENLEGGMLQKVLPGGSYSLKGVEYPVFVYFLQLKQDADLPSKTPPSPTSDKLMLAEETA